MSFLSSIPLVGRLIDAITGASSIPAARRLQSAPVHAVETNPEKRPRTLKHLLRGNHVNHALMYGDDNGRHNHMAHALCSAYLLGATPEQLNQIYDAYAPKLVAWQPSPAEIADVDWRDYLGDPAYQRAYVDFFEDVLAEHKVAYNWRTVVEAYILGQGRPQGDEDTVEVDGDQVAPIFSSRVNPQHGDGDNGGVGDVAGETDKHLLLNSLFCGLSHPIIHLAYAYEMDSRVLAMEALAMTAVTYNADYAKKYPFGRLPTADDVPDALRGLSLQQLVDRIAKDKRFDAVAPGSRIESLILEPPSQEVQTALLEYWHAWDLTRGAENNDGSDKYKNELTPRVRESQDVSVAMLVASVKPGTHAYNFFVCHALTSSHAVRVLLPEIPAALHVSVLQQWWLFTLAAYVAVGRPVVDPDNVPSDYRRTKGWTYVEQQAVSSRWSTDEHYIKTLRALKDAARTWGDIQDRYLNAAVWFADDFEGWVR